MSPRGLYMTDRDGWWKRDQRESCSYALVVMMMMMMIINELKKTFIDYLSDVRIP